MLKKRKTIATYARETELILLAMHDRLDDAQAERVVSLVRQGVDWDFILATAAIQRIRPQLYSTLSKVCPEDVPPDVFEQLQFAYRETAAYNLSLMHTNLQLLDLFEAQCIPVIPLKGPSQATALYGNLALREICDLDFLVHRKDLLAARDMFVKLGYRGFGPLPSDWDQDLEVKNGLYEYSMQRKDSRIHIELHWHILPQHSAYGLDEEYLWLQAAPVTMAGRTILAYPPEVVFLFACIHNEKHNWIYIRFLCDAMRMLAKYPDLDWDWILGEAKRLRRTDAVLLTVYLATRYWGIVLPPVIQALISQSPGILPRAALARARLFHDEFLLPRFSEWHRSLEWLEGNPTQDGFEFSKPKLWNSYLKIMLTPEYPDRQRLRWIPPQFSLCYFLARLGRFTRDMWFPICRFTHGNGVKAKK